MARRFPAGVPGLIQALGWIQREGATGALSLAGAGDGRGFSFRDGIVLGVSTGDEEAQPGAIREQARSLMEDWGFSESLLLFTEGADGGAPAGDAGRLNAADLILDLVRTSADPRWVRRRIADLKGAVRNPATLPKVLPRVAMSPTEAFLLSRADGTLTFDQILQISPMEATDVELSLYALAMVGLLEARGLHLPGDHLPETASEAVAAAPAGPMPGDQAPAPDVPVEEEEPGSDRDGSEANTPAPTGPAAEKAAPPASPAAAAGETQPPPPPEPSAEEAGPACDGAAPPARPRETGAEAVAGGGNPPAGQEPRADGDGGSPGAVPDPKAAPKPPDRATSALDDFLARTAAPSPAADPGGPAAAPSPPARSSPPATTGSYARSPELEKLRQEVLDWISTSAGTDHYMVLGVGRSADESEIRRAYYSLAKKFHPDKFRTPEFEGLLQDVERMFAATTEAYNTLTDDRARAEYESESARRSSGKPGGEADLAAQARESYLRARKHVESEEYFDAATLLETACRLDASKPEYWILLGTVQEKNPKWRRKAEASYKQVIEMDPTSADAYLRLARLYRGAGLQTKALEMFRKVVEWDPGNEEALAGISGKDGSQTSGVGSRIRSIFKGSKS